MSIAIAEMQLKIMQREEKREKEMLAFASDSGNWQHRKFLL